MKKLLFLPILLMFTLQGICQSIVDSPSFEQVDSTTMRMIFHTDSSAIITVHVAQDTTYHSALIFLGRTTGNDNSAAILMDRLAAGDLYHYRLFLGMKQVHIGTFSLEKKRQ